MSSTARQHFLEKSIRPIRAGASIERRRAKVVCGTGAPPTYPFDASTCFRPVVFGHWARDRMEWTSTGIDARRSPTHAAFGDVPIFSASLLPARPTYIRLPTFTPGPPRPDYARLVVARRRPGQRVGAAGDRSVKRSGTACRPPRQHQRCLHGTCRCLLVCRPSSSAPSRSRSLCSPPRRLRRLSRPIA